jgi:hypothetical protein
MKVTAACTKAGPIYIMPTKLIGIKLGVVILRLSHTKGRSDGICVESHTGGKEGRIALSGMSRNARKITEMTER